MAYGRFSLISSLLLLPFSLVSCSRVSPHPAQAHVIGGAAPAAFHPALSSAVGIFDAFGRPYCSGVLVGDGLVLTAAHCVEKLKTAGETRLVFGSSFSDPDGVVVTPSAKESLRAGRKHLAPNLDVGWFRFEGAPGERFRPVPLLTSPEALEELQEASVAGYGLTASGCREAACAGTLQVAPTRFESYHHNSRLRHLLTFGPTPGFSACRGDSGGPIYAKKEGQWVVAGIVTGNWVGLVPELAQGGDACDHGHFVATFAGGHAGWLEESSGMGLTLVPARPSVEPPFQRPGVGADFRAWCDFPDLGDEAWYTVQKLLDGAVAAFPTSEWPRRYADCAVAAAALAGMREFVHEGVRYDLGGIGQAQLRSLEPLAGFPELEKVELSRESLDSLESLAALPRLRSLSLLDNVERGEVKPRPLSLAAIEKMAALEELSLRRLSSAQGLESLGRAPRLRKLSLTACGLASVAPLTPGTSLQELDLSNNSLRDVSALVVMQGLRRLNLSSNMLKDVSALGAMTRLEHIDLRGNPIVNKVCPVPGAECLF